MTTPWARPPIPEYGDVERQTTYAHVGLVLSHWEEVEVALSHLYARFSGRGKDVSVLREYGKGTIFAMRAENLCNLAKAHFISTPSQQIEGEFIILINMCVGFSRLRNNVAHGIVQATQFSFTPSQQSGMMDIMGHQWCLLPPHYDGKNHSENDLHQPEYGFTSVEMEALTKNLIDLRQRVINFSDLAFG